MLVPLHLAIDRAVAVLGSGGPWLFFGAMALLPAAAVPMSAFSLTAGPVFASRMGMGGVVVAGVAATLANLALTYALARGALRPVLEKLMTRLGHRLPEIESGDAGDLIVVVRVSPVPFFIKNYLLGLANAPVAKYLAISGLIEGLYTAAFTLFGGALLHGRGRTALLAGCILVMAIALTHFARRHYAARKTLDAAGG